MTKISSILLNSKWKHMRPFHVHKHRLLFSVDNYSSKNPILIKCEDLLTSFHRHQINANYSTCVANSVSASTTSISNWNNMQGRNRGKAANIEIISTQKIKPSFPTLLEWKSYKISFLDQLKLNTYFPMLYFFPNKQQNNIDESTSERRHVLKQSLSETLTSFYPLAGKIKDNLRVECNDDGLYYAEARVSSTLSSFLERGDECKGMHKLLPFHPNSIELLFKSCVAMVQVNVFDCGGIAIGLYTSQKIIDVHSHITFVKAWAERASKCSKREIQPSYISPTLFIQQSSLPEDASFVMQPMILEQRKFVTKRFLFGSSSLSSLKEEIDSSILSSMDETNRDVMVLTGLIWKRVMAASEQKSGFKKPSVLSLEVDLRTRTSPPLSRYAIGNISWGASAKCGTENDDRELNSIVGKLSNAGGIDGDFVEGMKGEKGSKRVLQLVDESRKLYSNEETESLVVTNLCKSGIYEADFGWGKPSWCSLGNANGGMIVGSKNQVFFMDSRLGSNGIEAWVTLSEQDMAIFEKDIELLHFGLPIPSCETIVTY